MSQSLSVKDSDMATFGHLGNLPVVIKMRYTSGRSARVDWRVTKREMEFVRYIATSASNRVMIGLMAGLRSDVRPDRCSLR